MNHIIIKSRNNIWIGFTKKKNCFKLMLLHIEKSALTI